jgi:carbonic anhydrase
MSGTFCTVVNCMDGRVQLPVIRYLTDRFGVAFVDSVTEAGPVRCLADPAATDAKASILRRVGVSVDAHGSRTVAVVAHADCAGNPLCEGDQRRQLVAAVAEIARAFPAVRVLGLWVNDDWVVSEAPGAAGGPPITGPGGEA